MTEPEHSFDPLVEERITATSVVERAGNGQPLVVPRGETEAVPYDRASYMSNYLIRDIYHLKQWEMRYLAQSLGRNPDLAAEAAVQHYSTGPLTGTQPISARQAAGRELDDIIARALERERIHEAANAGTVVHKATEPGAPVDPMHPLMADAVREYHKLTAGLERVASEVFVVCDELRVAGTFDSGYLDPDMPGRVIVGDTKTGKGYHQNEFEMQLAIYAHGEIYLGPPKVEMIDGTYDPEYQVEHQRLTFEEYFGVPVNLQVGYLVHVPLLGKPKPRIVELDLERGWYYAQRAAEIRDDRRAFDQVGIGKKLDHKGKAERALQAAFDDLVKASDESDPSYISADEFRQRGLALHGRYSHVWPQEYTDEIKRRLS